MSRLTAGAPVGNPSAPRKTDGTRDSGGARRKGQVASLPGRSALESALAERCSCHQGGPWARPSARRPARDPPPTLTPLMKPGAASHVAEPFSWVPSPGSCPFPVVFPLSARVSPQTIHL